MSENLYTDEDNNIFVTPIESIQYRAGENITISATGTLTGDNNTIEVINYTISGKNWTPEISKKQDKLLFEYNNNDAISSINGSAFAQPEIPDCNSWKQWSEDNGSSGDSASVYIGEDNEVGENTYVFGSANSGNNSYIIGHNNSALDDKDPGNTAFNPAIIIGDTNSSTSGSHILGECNSAENNPYIIGRYNKARKEAFVIGKANTANMGGSTIGFYNINDTSYILGQGNTATTNAYVLGNNNYANCQSVSIGNAASADTVAFCVNIKGGGYSRSKSVAIGGSNSASNYAVSIGHNNSADSLGFCFGFQNTATNFGEAFGFNNIVNQYSFAFGSLNYLDQNCFAFGSQNRNSLKVYSQAAKQNVSNYWRNVLVGMNNGVSFGGYDYSASMSGNKNFNTEALLMGHENRLNFTENDTPYSYNYDGLMIGKSNGCRGEAVGNYYTYTGSPEGYCITIGKSNGIGSYEAINIGTKNDVVGHSIGFGWNNKTNDSYGAHSVLLGDSNSSYSDIEYLVSARNGALVTANKTKLVKVEKNIISNEDIASIKNYANQIVNLIDNCSSLNNTQKTNWKKYYAWYSIAYKADYLSTENNNILKTGWIWTDETYSAWYDRYYQAMYEYYYGTDKTTFINMIGDITTDVIQSLNNSTYEIWQNIDTIISKYETDGEIQFEVIPGYTTATDKVITNSFVAGTNNSANHYNSYVFGANNLTEFVNSANYQNDDGFVLAFGLGNFAARNYDMAIGYNAIASGGENIAIGTRSNSDYNPPRYTVAKGYKNIAYHSYIEGILNVGFASDVPLTFDKNNDSVYTNNIFNTVKNNVWNYSTLNFHDNRLDCVTGSTLGVQYNFNRNKLTYVSNSNIGVNGSYGHFAYNDLFMCDYGTTISAQYASKNTMRCLSGAKFYGTNLHDNIFYNLGVQTYISAFDINQNIIFDAGVNSGTSTTIQINLSATHFDKNYVFNSELVGSAMGAGFNHNLIMYSKITADNNALPNGIGYGYDTIGHSVLVGTNVNGQVTESFSFAASNTRSADAGAVTNAVMARVSKITNFGDNNIQNSYETQVFGEDNIVSSVGNSFVAGRKNLVQGPRNGYVVNDSYVTNNNVVFGDANAISNSDNAADDRLTNSIILGKANGIYKNCSDSKYYITDNTIIGSVNGLYKIPATAIDNVLTKGMYNWVEASAKFPYQNIIHKANESFIASGKYLVNLYGGNESYNNARNLIMGSHSVISNNINDSTLIGSFNAAYNSATDVWSNNYVIGSFNLAANGSNQIVLGNSNIASGHNAMPMGEGLIANTSQTVFGRYNEVLDGTNGLSADDIDSKSGALLIVGNGRHILDKSDTASIERSNAMIVSANGVVSATNLQTSAGYVVTDVMLTSAQDIQGSDFEDDYSFVTNGVADLTPLYNYIKSLEDRIAALEAAAVTLPVVNGDNPTVNGDNPII